MRAAEAHFSGSLPEPREVGMDAEVGSIQLDALAVDLDKCSGGRHILQGSGGRMVAVSGWDPDPDNLGPTSSLCCCPS